VELYQNLTEEEANEMLVLLAENGIKAGKKRVLEQNVASFAINVREADIPRSRSLLLQHNLPRRRELGLTGVYKEKGLIPTPDEQKARYLLALKGEIINSLERLPQIVDVDVVLNVPEKNEFADPERQKLQRPTASVVVKIKPEAGDAQTITEPKVQQFVANAVEGMNPRDVAVMISYITLEERGMRPHDVRALPTQMPGIETRAPAAPTTTKELIGLKLDAESRGRLKIYLLVFFLLLVVLSSTLIVVIVQASRMRRTLAALKGPSGEHPAIEGQVLEEGPPRLPQGGAPPEGEL
jgi:type III secretion protein J